MTDDKERNSPYKTLCKRCEVLGVDVKPGQMGRYANGGYCITYNLNGEVTEGYFKTIKDANGFLNLYAKFKGIKEKPL